LLKKSTDTSVDSKTKVASLLVYTATRTHHHTEN
jgi:hypothetical protein